ncbi:pentatricopeptide repeat-containing protein At5g59600 [Phoenix dactylifera]|uniref:Pentatricopeptide repeat-containing protein At5g59600 n=1 Tax=Phoenix dactylifera TaxID=42345 RepID=A0A8B7CLI2_PHODC|nr:pentatricopeptide repeat-containing protein At5g59600 [Phoenix dactylifera]
MCKANPSHWIAQISYFSRQGLHKETLRVFHRLLHEGLRPDRYVLPGVLRACANLSDLKSGRAAHTLATRSLLDSDAFIASALIDMYSKCGKLHGARRVFDRTGEKDLVVWNSMVSGYAHGGLAETAVVLVIKMRSLGVKPDLVTWNALISGFSRMGNDVMAMDLFRSMQVDGVEPDVVSWTSIISGYVLNFKYDEAFGMFKQMVVVAGIRPSSVTISSLLPACAHVADLRHGKEIHGYAVVTGVDKDLFVGSALVDMYAKCGLISEAARIFDKMQERSSVSWNSMIFGYSNHGYCENAIRLFYQMQHEHAKPDHLTFTAVFTACSHAGMVELGNHLFILMQECHGIEPRLEHYACMVDLLGKAGKLAEAYDLIKGMPMEPDSFVWGALLGACRCHGNVELAKTAALHLFEIEPESAGSCVILSSMLLDAGRQADAVKMKKLMKKQKMKKFLGCSWIEST